MDPAPERPTFQRRHRLTHRREFEAVFDAKARASVAGITIFTKPNDLGHARLGLSIGRRVGSAVVRSRVKRLIREAFRLTRAELPGSYDLVVSVRSAEGLTLERSIQSMRECARKTHDVWQRRARRTSESSESEEGPP